MSFENGQNNQEHEGVTSKPGEIALGEIAAWAYNLHPDNAINKGQVISFATELTDRAIKSGLPEFHGQITEIMSHEYMKMGDNCDEAGHEFEKLIGVERSMFEAVESGKH